MSDQTSTFTSKHGPLDDKVKIVRQDRIEAKSGSACIKIAKVGANLAIINFSPFGLLAQCPEDTRLEIPETIEAVFVLHDFEVQELKLNLIRRGTADAKRFFAFEIQGEPLNLDAIRGIDAAVETIDRIDHQKKARAKLRTEFHSAVIELKDWLGALASATAEIENKLVHNDPYARSVFESAHMQTLYRYLARAFPPHHMRLIKLLDKLEGNELKHHVEFFREQVGPIINQAPFSFRALHKPRGYAGDFEMMNHLYRNTFEGKNLFAQALHFYFINEPAGQAVRNRRQYLTERISDTIERRRSAPFVKILSVASGPAREIQDTVERTEGDSPLIQWHLLDQDEQSLKGAQFEIKRRLGSNERHSFNLIHRSIKDVIVGGVPVRSFDLIYSAGLFDYFSDPVAQLAATKLYESLAPGGNLIIGNFSLENPTLPLMEIAWDWHLIYRSAEDLKTLFKDVGPLTIESEPLGINLFAVLKKPI